MAAGAQIIEILRELESASLRNAEALPARRAEAPSWKGLGFQVGGLRLVAELGEIVEILKLPRVTPLPRVRDWLLGVANVRGRLLPIIDMHRAAGIASTAPRVNWRVLVLEHDDLVVGLLVEQSLGMQRFQTDTFEAAAADAPPLLQPYLSGAYRSGGRLFNVVKLRELIRDDRLMDVALS
jgi:twitching motility protein PilI